MRSTICCIVLVTGCLSSIEAVNFRNILTSTADVTTGVLTDATNKLPTSKGLFETSKQLVGGYPFEVASAVINQICK